MIVISPLTNTMLTISKMPKRKKIKRYLIRTLCIVIILWIGFGLFLNITDNDYKRLKKMGYHNKEIDIIMGLLDKKERKTVYQHPYMASLTNLIYEDTFLSNKLESYLTLYENNPNLTNDQLLFIVNNDLEDIPVSFTEKILDNDNMKIELVKRYFDYDNLYHLNIDDTIYAVNHDLDLYNLKYSADDKKYIEEDDFIISNLEKYRDYHKKKKKLSIKQVIKEVNKKGIAPFFILSVYKTITFTTIIIYNLVFFRTCIFWCICMIINVSIYNMCMNWTNVWYFMIKIFLNTISYRWFNNLFSNLSLTALTTKHIVITTTTISIKHK